MKNRLVGVLLVIAFLSVPIALALSRQDGVRGGGRIGAPSVAIIELTGTIADASGDSGSSRLGIRPILEHLARAREDRRISAVVLRVNSGGGSAAASQEIHRAILKVREAGKPVVISMGDVAASGAYYVSTAADRILANPATITGSIGVYFRYLDASGLADRYGVEFVTVKTGPHKDVGNPTQPLTDEQRAVLQSLVDNTLEQFIAAVVAGRGLSDEDVRQIADGRILTGEQAKNLGLVDDFGGLEDAIWLAAELAGIEGEPNVIRLRNPVPWYARYLDVQSRLLNSAEERLILQLFDKLVDAPGELRLMY